MANYNFNLLSLNARGIRDYFKRKSIFTWVKQQNTDIVFLQETYSTPDIENEWKSEESLEHLFCYCEHSITFWKSVVLWLKSIDIDIDFLSDSDIFFGLAQKNLNWVLLNHIIIIGKQVIYSNRLKNFLPVLPQVLLKIKYVESIKRFIALKNNKLKIHDEKWKPIITFL